MAIFGLSKHKVVEVGKLNGLLTGKMEAQSKLVIDTVASGNDYLDNGFILAFDTATGNLEKAAAGSGEMFLHYTEELMDGPVNGYEYFTVVGEVEGTNYICYPRAIRLELGDEFVTNNFGGTLPEVGSTAVAQVVNGVITITATPVDGPLFLVTKDTLPNGTAAASVKLITFAYDAAEE